MNKRQIAIDFSVILLVVAMVTLVVYFSTA